jgi:hypothetical protein
MFRQVDQQIEIWAEVKSLIECMCRRAGGDGHRKRRKARLRGDASPIARPCDRRVSTRLSLFAQSLHLLVFRSVFFYTTCLAKQHSRLRKPTSPASSVRPSRIEAEPGPDSPSSPLPSIRPFTMFWRHATSSTHSDIDLPSTPFGHSKFIRTCYKRSHLKSTRFYARREGVLGSSRGFAALRL